MGTFGELLVGLDLWPLDVQPLEPLLFKRMEVILEMRLQLRSFFKYWTTFRVVVFFVRGPHTNLAVHVQPSNLFRHSSTFFVSP